MEHRQTRHASRGRLFGGGILAAILLTATAAALQWQRPDDPPEHWLTTATTPEHSNASPAKQPPSGQLLSDDGAASVPAIGDDAADAAAVPQEPALAEQLVGIWHLERHGERTLHIHADGTATAEVKLNMLGALMYGERMTLQLNWTLQDDVMTQTITSGTPQEAVQRLIRDWGDRREYRVIEASDEQLVLSEVGDDGDRDVWTSVESTPSTTASRTTQSPR